MTMFHVKHHITLDDLYNFLQAQGIHINTNQIDKFKRYIDLIKSWSMRQNLVSRNDLPDLVEKHILPSLMLDYVISWKKNSTVLDVGSGAGFPGLILKVMQPHIELTLVDSVRKKYLFLIEACELLSFTCTVINQRVEDFKLIRPKKFDIVVCRAVAELGTFWMWVREMLIPAGHLYALKGGDYIREVDDINDNAIKIEIIKPAKAWIDFSPGLQSKRVINVEKING